MTRIFTGYPRKLKTNLLVEVIDEYADEINQSGADINKMLQYAPYISLGLNELQGRQSRLVTRITLGISLLSLFVAGSALYVSYANSLASSSWEQNQIEILNQLNSRFGVISSQNENQVNE